MRVKFKYELNIKKNSFSDSNSNHSFDLKINNANLRANHALMKIVMRVNFFMSYLRATICGKLFVRLVLTIFCKMQLPPLRIFSQTIRRSDSIVNPHDLFLLNTTLFHFCI